MGKLSQIVKDYRKLRLLLMLGPLILSPVLCILFAVIRFDFDFVFGGIMVFPCLIYPIELPLINLIALIRAIRHPQKQMRGMDEAKLYGSMDLFTIITGGLITLFYATIIEINRVDFTAEWNVQLHNTEVHQPVWTGAIVTVSALLVIGVIGYLVLNAMDMSRTPPLLSVLCIGAMYLGVSQLIVFIIQIMKFTPHEGLCYNNHDIPALVMFPLTVLPLCCISMVARLIIRKIYEWNADESHNDGRYDDNGFINGINRVLSHASTWPVAAVIAALPLLGVLLAVLALFGQRPDNIIKAWTETAQWNLSRQTAPPNVMYDEHYLCTVAAGGHEKLVRPVRMGLRHGHRIVVNRQLLIANAFEQILEEKTPRFHKAVRSFYDTHGYPIARHIKTKAAADIVYIIMKPLEWIFLIVLYLVDPRPEDRIAVQYMK